MKTRWICEDFSEGSCQTTFLESEYYYFDYISSQGCNWLEWNEAEVEDMLEMPWFKGNHLKIIE